MKKSNLLQLCLWGLCALVVSGCEQKSSSIWEANQTGAKYKYSEKNASSLWDSSPVAGPVNDEFVPLNDEDLKTQFADASAPQPSHGLGEAGVPGADQFDSPKG